MDHIQKVERWQRMVEITDSANDSMRTAMYPFLSVLAGTNRIGGIERVERAWNLKGMVVHHVDHCSGGPYYHEITVPEEVWNSEDPVSAATEHVEKQKAERAMASRLAKIRELERLTKELTGEEP